MPQDYRAMYEAAKGKREPFIIRSQKIARLVQDTLRIDPLTKNLDGPKSVTTPFSDVGPRCNKGMASIISNLLNPPNLSSFRLESNVKFGLSPDEQNLLDALYIEIEKLINGFKDQNGYKPYQYQALISAGINGNIATKVTEDGYMRYDIDSFVFEHDRNYGIIKWAIFEECIVNDEGKKANQYIYVDYDKDEVWLQVDDKNPVRQTGEFAEQYVISSLTVSGNDNYAPSVFADHYGVLSSINKSWEYLEEAQDLAGYNIQTFTGPPTISTRDLSRIPRRSVIRVPNHDVLKWQGIGTEKLNAWNWVSTLVVSREQQLLANFGIGLLQRAGQLQTATEVRAVMNELMALTGPLAIIWSDSFSLAILKAEMRLLKVSEKLQAALAAKGLAIPASLKSKLIVPTIVSGVSSLARSESAEQMLNGIGTLIKQVGVTPEAVQAIVGSLDIREVMKSYLDNINVDTSKIIQNYVPPQPGQAPQGPAPDQSQVAAVSNLPPELVASLPPQIQKSSPDVIAQYLLAQTQQSQQ